jgi:hypothetical protein
MAATFGVRALVGRSLRNSIMLDPSRKGTCQMATYPNAPQATDTTTATRSNGLAVAGLVCGIVGLLLFNIVLGPLAIIFGGIAFSRAKRGAPHRTMSLWAIGLGIVDLVILVVLLVAASHNGGSLYFHAG